MIHPTAVIHPTARIGKGVTVGPYAVVDQRVVIGDECHIGPHVHLTGVTKIGKMNRFHSGAVIGDAPQDLKYNDEPTGLAIGDENVFREHVTVHRSNKSEENTIIGSGCLFMAGSHVGHNSIVGDQVIVANGALLGGHVTVHDRAFLSGNCLVHQYVTVGTLALMQGGAAVSKDVPPYCIAAGDNGISGLNSVGLRRSGMPIAERNELRRVYHKLFLRTNRVAEVLGSIDDELEFEASRLLVDFVRLSKRGVCAHAKRA